MFEAFSQKIIDRLLSLGRLIYWHINKGNIIKMCQTIIDAFANSPHGYEGKHFTINFYTWGDDWVVKYKGEEVAHHNRARGWIILRNGDWFGEFVELYQRGREKTFGKYEGAI